MGFAVLYGCDPVGLWVSLSSMASPCWFCCARWCDMGFAMLSIQWIFGFRHVGFDLVVIWVFWVSLCYVVQGWLCCGLLCYGLAVLVKLQRWCRRVGFAVLSIWLVFGFRCVGCDPVMIWVFWVSLALWCWVSCAGLAVLWVGCAGEASAMERQR